MVGIQEMEAGGSGICRLCLASGSKTKLLVVSKDLRCKALLCVNVKIQPKYESQSMICKLCARNLDNFYIFKKSCMSNDLKYKLQKKHREKGLVIKDEPIYSWLKKEEETEDKYEVKDEDAEEYSDNVEDELIYNCLKEKEGTEEKYKDEDAKEFSLNIELKALPKIPPKGEQVKVISKIFQCDTCGRTFKQKAVLRQHIISHMKLKLHTCPICPKKFARAEDKRVHFRKHSGIKPFICEICGKTNTKRQDLLRHMLIHSDEKKHKCPQCTKRFRRINDVRSHLRSHTENRPYSCDGCIKCYKSYGALKKHLMHCKNTSKKQ